MTCVIVLGSRNAGLLLLPLYFLLTPLREFAFFRRLLIGHWSQPFC
jgi:hypothetical protein